MNTPDDRTSPAPPHDPSRATVTSDPAIAAETGSQGTQDHVSNQAYPSQSAGLPVVPGFVLLGEIGRGGMGLVYRARDTALHRDVAIKILQDRYPPAGAEARRFVEESQITSQLQHPGIPPIHQVGALADGRPFLAMKLIKGNTLDKLLKERRTLGDERGRFLAIFEQICQAVGYAHAHDVVHRDLKPANIMVGAFGEVQVMDWGLSKSIRDVRVAEAKTVAEETPHTEIAALRDVDSATQTGSVMGTPAFMPPEQAGGEIAKIDVRSDVFSLGAVLCVLLTGRPPYVAEGVDAVRLMAIRAELGNALARLNDCGAEPELAALCQRCLAVKREDRPTDANALAAAVAGLRSAAEERARQAELDRVRAEGERAVAEARAAEERNTRREAEARALEQRKKRKVQLALAAAVGLLLAAGGGFAWYSDRQAGAQKLKDELAESDRKAELQRVDSERKQSEAELKGEADAERRFKAEQARQSVRANLNLTADLRKQYKFKTADAALVQAAAMALSGAPELLEEVEQARSDLAFVVKLDDIRFRKWLWIGEPGGKGNFNTKIAAPEYRQAFAERGLDLEKLAPNEAAQRIAASAVKSDLVAAVDDWALYEPNAALRARLLEIVRKADPGEWTDRLRNPLVWREPDAVAKLAANADPATTSPSTLSVLAALMERNGLSPASLLTSARANYPSNFELAFALGQWHQGSKDGRQIGSYEAARALRPENLPVWHNLGIALADKGDFAAAVAACKKAVELDPKLAQAYSNLGNALKAGGDLPGAVAAFKKAIELEPNFAPGYSNLGNALSDKGDLPGAIAAYKKAIELDPKLAGAYSNLGIALKDNGDLPGAITACKKAVELDRKYTQGYSNLGIALFDNGDLPGAVAAFKKAIELDPNFAHAYSNLGSVLKASGDLPGAVAACRKAIELDPKYAHAYSNLGNALKAGGDLPGAITAFKKAIELDPKYAQAYSNFGNALAEKRDFPGAVAAYKKAIELDPKLAQAYSNLGSALKASGDLPGAVAACRKAIELDPNFAKYYYNLGIALSDKGDLPGAIAAYKKAVELDPKLARAYSNLGSALKDIGDFPGAIAACKKAIELDPKYAHAHTNLGAVYLDQKKYTEAIACARAAIKADPRYSNAHAMFGYTLQQTGDISGARAAITEAARLDKRWAGMLAKLPPIPVAPAPREVKR